jgi:cullin 3
LDDLSRLYRLFIMVPIGLPYLRKALKESIMQRGKEINRASAGAEDGDGDIDTVGNEEDKKGKARTAEGAQMSSLPLKWVRDVLDLKDKFDYVWREAFRCDRDLKSALNKVCIRLIESIRRPLTIHLCRPSNRS